MKKIELTFKDGDILYAKDLNSIIDHINTSDNCAISITNIVESDEDRGKNIITFSDGQNITIRNGSKGSTGATGAAGYTPIKGIDYFTSADKVEMVSTLIKETGIDVVPDYVIAEAEGVIGRVIAA